MPFESNVLAQRYGQVDLFLREQAKPSLGFSRPAVHTTLQRSQPHTHQRHGDGAGMHPPGRGHTAAHPSSHPNYMPNTPPPLAAILRVVVRGGATVSMQLDAPLVDLDHVQLATAATGAPLFEQRISNGSGAQAHSRPQLATVDAHLAARYGARPVLNILLARAWKIASVSIADGAAAAEMHEVYVLHNTSRLALQSQLPAAATAEWGGVFGSAPASGNGNVSGWV